MQDVEQVIRERAYHLWIAEGRQGGNEIAHWLAAQREILAASIKTLGTGATAAPKAKKPKKVTAKKVKAA
jgi:hypothetical protein